MRTPGTQFVTNTVGYRTLEASSSLLYQLTHFIPLDLFIVRTIVKIERC